MRIQYLSVIFWGLFSLMMMMIMRIIIPCHYTVPHNTAVCVCVRERRERVCVCVGKAWLYARPVSQIRYDLSPTMSHSASNTGVWPCLTGICQTDDMLFLHFYFLYVFEGKHLYYFCSYLGLNLWTNAWLFRMTFFLGLYNSMVIMLCEHLSLCLLFHSCDLKGNEAFYNTDTHALSVAWVGKTVVWRNWISHPIALWSGHYVLSWW